MVINKKGQMVLVGLMLAIVVFIMVVNFIPIIKEQVVQARNPAHLDCGNSSISVEEKMTCVTTGLSLFSYVTIGLFAAISLIGLKKIGFIGNSQQ